MRAERNQRQRGQQYGQELGDLARRVRQRDGSLDAPKDARNRNPAAQA